MGGFVRFIQQPSLLFVPPLFGSTQPKRIIQKTKEIRKEKNFILFFFFIRILHVCFLFVFFTRFFLFIFYSLVLLVGFTRWFYSLVLLGFIRWFLFVGFYSLVLFVGFYSFLLVWFYSFGFTRLVLLV